MDCSICFEEISDEEQSVLKCDHTFHKECIDEWFKKSHRCPLCRNSLFNISCSDRQQNYWERVTESDQMIRAETNIIFRDNIDN